MKLMSRLTVMIGSPRPIPRQIATLVLGHVRYNQCRDRLKQIFQMLWYQLADGAKVRLRVMSRAFADRQADVETRQYAVRSLISILGQRDEDELLGA
jgi:hypothetical protein